MSDKIDKWVESDPESWSKLANNLKQKRHLQTLKRNLKKEQKPTENITL